MLYFMCMAEGDVQKENKGHLDRFLGRIFPKGAGIGESDRSNGEFLKPYMVRPLTSEENHKIEQAVHDPNQLELTRTLLSKEELKPVNLLTIGKRNFFVALPGNFGGTLIMFYEDSYTGKLLPRVVVESVSGKTWRTTSGDGPGGYSKGTGIHYTQEAKSHENIIRYIMQYSADRTRKSRYGTGLIEKYFGLSTNKGRLTNSQAEWYTFDKEIKRYDDKGVLKQFQKYQPGYLKQEIFGKNANLSARFRSFDFSDPTLKAFVPSFKNPPVRTDVSRQPPEVFTLETYIASLNGRPVEWVMAYDRLGRVWIDRIAFLDIEVNSYGVMPEVIDSGCLTHKPIEYHSQVNALRPNEYANPRGDIYVDITPLLDNLAPIKAFRKARNIVRRRVHFWSREAE